MKTMIFIAKPLLIFVIILAILMFIWALNYNGPDC